MPAAGTGCRGCRGALPPRPQRLAQGRGRWRRQPLSMVQRTRCPRPLRRNGGRRSPLVLPSPLPLLSDTPVPSRGPRAVEPFPAVSKPLSGADDSHQASEVLKRCSTAAGIFPLSLKRTRGWLAGVTLECPAGHERLPRESSHPVQKLVICHLQTVVVLDFGCVFVVVFVLVDFFWGGVVVFCLFFSPVDPSISADLYIQLFFPPPPPASPYVLFIVCTFSSV